MRVRMLVGGAIGDEGFEVGDLVDTDDEAQAEAWIEAGVASADLDAPERPLEAPETASLPEPEEESPSPVGEPSLSVEED